MQVCVNTRTRKYMYMYAHSSDKFELNHDSSPDKSIFKRYLKLLTPLKTLVLKEDNRFLLTIMFYLQLLLNKSKYSIATIINIQLLNCL